MKRINISILVILIISSSLMYGQRIFRPSDPVNLGRYGKSPYSGPPFLYFGSTSYQYHIASSQYNNFISDVDAAFSRWNNAGQVQFSRTTSNGLTLIADAQDYDDKGPAWSFPSWNGSTYELTPSSAVIVLNTSNTTWSNTEQHLNTSPHVIDVQTMVVHEAGHINGLAHPLTSSYAHNSAAPSMAGGDNEYFDNTLDCRSLEIEDIYGTDFLQLRVPTFYSGIQSALDKAEDIGVGYIYVTSNYTLPANITSTVSNMHIIIKSGVTFNLNGKSVILSNGTITVESGATINGLAAKIINGSGILKGLSGTIQGAINLGYDKGTIYIQSGSFGEYPSITNKDHVIINGQLENTLVNGFYINNSSYAIIYGLRTKTITVTNSYRPFFNEVTIEPLPDQDYSLFMNNVQDVGIPYLNLINEPDGAGAVFYDCTGVVWGNSSVNSNFEDFDVATAFDFGTSFNMYNPYFCGNNTDITTDGTSSVYVSNGTFSGDPNYTTSGNVSWNYWSSCGMPKANITSANFENSSVPADEFSQINRTYGELNVDINNDILVNGIYSKGKYESRIKELLGNCKDFIKNNSNPSFTIAALNIVNSCFRELDDLESMRAYLLEIINNPNLKIIHNYAKRKMIEYFRVRNDINSAMNLANEILNDKSIDENMICNLLYSKGIMNAYYLNKTGAAIENFSTIINNHSGNVLAKAAQNELFLLDKKGKNIPQDEVTEIDNLGFTTSNYPNPFNPTTIINYTLPSDEKVVIKVFDILGREVTELVNEYKTAGKYSVNFDANSAGGGLSSGTYFYTITAGDYHQSKKIILLK